jgi:hypothetical protein
MKRCLSAAVVVALASFAALAACSKQEGEGVQYGDAVGIRMSGSGAAPAYEIAVAITKGKDIGPSVNSVAGSVYVATKSCPGVSQITGAGSMLRLKFAVEEGKVAPVKNMPSEAAAACLLKALEGKELLPGTKEHIDVLAEIRALDEKGT